MWATLKQNLYPAVALVILPCGYYLGTVWRDKHDSQANNQISEKELSEIRAQVQALREEREALLNKKK